MERFGDGRYHELLIETYHYVGAPTEKPIRARALAGQGISTSINVECSYDNMRARYPVGTVFKVRAKLTSRLGGTPFLYTNYAWSFDVMKGHEIEEFLARL